MSVQSNDAFWLGVHHGPAILILCLLAVVIVTAFGTIILIISHLPK